MSRILFVVQPMEGHIFPNIPIALELKKKGHSIAFATGESMGRFVKDTAGIKLYSVGHDLNPKNIAELYPELRIKKGISGRMNVTRIILKALKKEIEDLLIVFKEFCPDLIVCDSLTFSAPIACELNRIPWATSSLYLMMLPGKDAQAYGAGLRPRYDVLGRLRNRLLWSISRLYCLQYDWILNSVRRSFGLASLNSPFLLSTLSPFLYLSFTFPEYEYPRKDIPAQVYLVGPSIWERKASQEEMEMIDSLKTKNPLIVVSMASSQDLWNPWVYGIVKEAIISKPIHLLILRGAYSDPDDLGIEGDNITVMGFVPNNIVFPYADAVIHHGGTGTVFTALKFGIPSIIIPFITPHFEDARRCAEKGLAIIIKPSRLNKNKLSWGIKNILRDKAYKERAIRMAEIMKSYDSASTSSDLIEELLKKGAPVLRKENPWAKFFS